jgi:hypothetical protein
MSLPPAPEPRSPLYVAGIVALGCVVLCGLAGSCLLALGLFVPLFQQ